MIITCSTCQKEEKECTWVKYLIYAVLLHFQICRNLRILFAKSVFPKFQSSQKKCIFQVWSVAWDICYFICEMWNVKCVSWVWGKICHCYLFPCSYEKLINGNLSDRPIPLDRSIYSQRKNSCTYVCIFTAQENIEESCSMFIVFMNYVLHLGEDLTLIMHLKKIWPWQKSN